MRMAVVSFVMVCIGLLLPALVPGDDQQPAAAANAANPANPVPANAAVAAANSFRGRLPPNYGKVGVDAVQKAKIYAVQGAYAAKIDALEAQLAQLKTQRDAEVRAVLTAAQQKQLDEILGAKKTAKALVDAKMAAPPAAMNPAPPAGNNVAPPAGNNAAPAANAVAGAKAEVKAVPGKAAMKPTAKGVAKAADTGKKDDKSDTPQAEDAKDADKSSK
jgi:hypothetical protein